MDTNIDYISVENKYIFFGASKWLIGNVVDSHARGPGFDSSYKIWH
jgi:hypothetical protein